MKSGVRWGLYGGLGSAGSASGRFLRGLGRCRSGGGRWAGRAAAVSAGSIATVAAAALRPLRDVRAQGRLPRDGRPSI